jgi:hypothetical protein
MADNLDTPYDVVFQDKASSPSTEVGLMLAHDDEGNKRVREFELPPLPPRRSDGSLNWTHHDPLVDFQWAQDDWSGGALRPYYRDGSNHYARSSYVDARWDGVLAAGMQRSKGQSYFILRNTDAELNASGTVGATGWTAGTGVTLTVHSEAKKTGAVGFKFVTDGSRSNGDVLMSQTFVNSHIWQGCKLKVGAYVSRQPDGSESGIRIQLLDGSTTTSGATVTGSSFTFTGTGEATIGASATTITVQLVTTADETGAHMYYADDFFVFPTGGVECTGVAAADTGRLKNPGAEDNNTTGWAVTASSGTVAITNTNSAPHSGSRHFRMLESTITTFGDPLALSTFLVTFTPTFSNDLRHKLVTFEAYVKVTAAQTTAKIHIGDNTDATLGESALITATSYTKVTASAYITAAATSIRIQVQGAITQAGGSTRGVDFDSMRLYSTPATESNLFASFGRVLAEYNSSHDTWDAAYVDDTDTITDLIAFDGDLIFALGNHESYRYGLYAEGGEDFLESEIASGADKAKLFTVSRERLWKTEHGNTIKSSTNPRAGGSWSSAYTVGSSEMQITGLHSYADSVLVGKEDGLWRYIRVYNDGASADLFENLTNEWTVSHHEDNFSQSQDWHGWLYLTTSQQGLVRYNGMDFEDLGALFMAPRLTDFGGRIRQLVADPHQLWLLVDTPQADSSVTKDTRLISLRMVEGRWRVHTIADVNIGVISNLVVTGGRLLAFGELYNSDLSDSLPAIYNWHLPNKTPAPYADEVDATVTPARPAIEQTQTMTFESSIWHGGMPGTDKAFLALTLWVEDTDSEHTIVAKYGLDGADSDDKTLGTFSGTGRIQTLYFNDVTTPATNAVGKMIQLNFTLTTDDVTSPKIYAFALHSTLRPDRVRAWEMMCEINPGSTQMGYIDPQAKSTILSNLATLRDQVYPCVFKYDEDGDGALETTTVYLREPEWVIEHTGESGNERKQLLRVVAQQAITSS